MLRLSRRNNLLLLLAILSGIASVHQHALAQSAQLVGSYSKNAERGWYFFDTQPKLKALLKGITKKGSQQKKIKKIGKPCSSAPTWNSNCGFVDPTMLGLSKAKAYQFEQQQYKSLMHNYAMYPNNQEAVYNFQKFNMWVLNKAMTASYTWQYNVAQHPDVDANVQVPVSQFGIAMIKNIEHSSEADFWKTLSKTAFFVLATRTNNKECQAQGTLMLMLQKETGVTVWNFSVDNGHLPGFKHFMNYPHLKTDEQHSIAYHLKLNWLPTVYLYLKPSGDRQVGRWIRVTSGITPVDQIKQRTINFVQAYRHSILQGVGKSRHRVPDFSVNHLYALADEHLGLNHKADEKHQQKMKENK